MYSRINYTMVGLFVLLMGAGMLMFGFWLAKYGFEQKYQYYVIYFDEPVDGLTVDSSVKLNGVDVGKVVTIEVSPTNYAVSRVKVKLKEGTPITTSMYAVLKPQGITGLSYIEITGAKKGDKMIEIPSSGLPQIPSRHSFLYTLQEKAPDILNKLSSAMDRIDRVLSERNIEKFNKILSNTEKFTDSAVALSDTIQKTLDDINSSVVSAADSVDEAGDYFGKMSRDLTQTADIINKTLPKIMKRVDRLTVKLNSVTQSIDLALKRGDFNFEKIIKPIRIDIDELSYKYRELAQDLQSITMDPSKALFSDATVPPGPGER